MTQLERNKEIATRYTVSSLVKEGKVFPVSITVADDIVEKRAFDEGFPRGRIASKGRMQQNLAASGKSRPAVFLILVYPADAQGLAKIFLMDANDTSVFAAAVIAHDYVGLVFSYPYDVRVRRG